MTCLCWSNGLIGHNPQSRCKCDSIMDSKPKPNRATLSIYILNDPIFNVKSTFLPAFSELSVALLGLFSLALSRSGRWQISEEEPTPQLNYHIFSCWISEFCLCHINQPSATAKHTIADSASNHQDREQQWMHKERSMESSRGHLGFTVSLGRFLQAP